jgi:hypothetical protein
MSNVHDDDPGAHDADAQDLDGAKILSRRAKLIAAALSGLSMTVSCGDDGGPSPCLSVGVGGAGAGAAGAGGGGGEGGTGGPMACLSPQLGGGGTGGAPGGGGAGGSSG